MPQMVNCSIKQSLGGCLHACLPWPCCMQMNGVKYCLKALGPWGAAAAAHLDLLSAAPEEPDAMAEGDGYGETGSAGEVPSEGEGEEVGAGAEVEPGAWMSVVEGWVGRGQSYGAEGLKSIGCRLAAGRCT